MSLSLRLSVRMLSNALVTAFLLVSLTSAAIQAAPAHTPSASATAKKTTSNTVRSTVRSRRHKRHHHGRYGRNPFSEHIRSGIVCPIKPNGGGGGGPLLRNHHHSESRLESSQQFVHSVIDVDASGYPIKLQKDPDDSKYQGLLAPQPVTVDISKLPMSNGHRCIPIYVSVDEPNSQPRQGNDAKVIVTPTVVSGPTGVNTGSVFSLPMPVTTFSGDNADDLARVIPVPVNSILQSFNHNYPIRPGTVSVTVQIVLQGQTIPNPHATGSGWGTGDLFTDLPPITIIYHQPNVKIEHGKSASGGGW